MSDERPTNEEFEELERELQREMQRKRLSRRPLFVLIIVIAATVLSAGGVARFYTDLLWYREIGFTQFFVQKLWLQVVAVAAGWAIASAFLWVNLRLAAQGRPPYALSGLRERGVLDELRLRYREFLEPYKNVVVGIAAVLAGVILAAGLRDLYPEIIFFVNAQDFGIADPVFNRDAGFYVFRVPLLSRGTEYFWVLLIITLLLCAAFYVLNGSIDPSAVIGERITKRAKVHLSILLAGLALLQAGRYFFDRFDLLNSDRGVVSGASATDINATLPAYNLLIAISMVVAAVLIVNVFRRGWALPVASVGIWILVQFLGVEVFPSLYQRLSVQPQEFVREEEYIRRNIEFTRYAYALSDIGVERYFPSQNLTFERISSEGLDASLRVWDSEVTEDVFNQLQALRAYYSFTDVDVDRYQFDGSTRAVMIATREIDRSQLPSQTWVNRHLQFTHGYGVVVSGADVAAEDGRPRFYMQDLPPKTMGGPAGGSEELTITVPQIYYGDRPSTALGEYVIVKTTQPEFDFPRGDAPEVTFQYDGGGGIPLSNGLRRLAFALRFGDLNPLISRQITPESRLIFRTDVQERVNEAFPFLILDYDPYPVIVDGRVKWIQDAYTFTTRFPYSQKLDAARVDRGPEIVTERLPRNSTFRLVPDTNYVRNSVKAVVDAYDGTVDLYVVDDNDPVVRALRRGFPSLFRDGSEMPESLRRHLRYPEELFRIQANMFRIYHVTDARLFYNQEDKWQVPERTVRTGQGQQKLPLEPYYTILKDPRDGRDSFFIIQPFTPQGRPNLLGFILANSDPDRYGEMIAYALPPDRLTDGPEQVTARINQDPEISQELTLLDQRGSRVLFGNLLTLPVAGDLLYLQPVFLVPEDTALPTLQRVIVVYKDRAVMRGCVAAALRDALSPMDRETACVQGPATGIAAGEAPVEAREGIETGRANEQAPPAVTSRDALANAARAYDEAQAALRRGDLAEYQRKVDEMKRWIDEARASSGS